MQNRGGRKSNIELLRLVAMGMVLCLHMNFKTFGIPDLRCEGFELIVSIIRVFLESLCAVSVNVFILISGYFGIRFSYRGLIKFLFQCVFIISVSYLFLLLLGSASFNIHNLMQCMCLSKSCWFIISYIGLYILSPVLNAFLDKSSVKQLQKLLFIYSIYAVLWGWIVKSEDFNNGYSCLSFIGMYILGHYLKLIKYHKFRYGVLYIVSTVINAILCSLFILFFKSHGVYLMISYLNPLIVFQSCMIFLYFANIKIKQSKIINTFAKSAFAVYLIHDCANFQVDNFQKLCYLSVDNNLLLSLINLSFVFIGIYSLAISLDKIRLFIWDSVCKK